MFPIGPPTEDEDIAKKIFNSLQMFQYLEDVRNYDEKPWSTFIPHSVKLNDKINVEFLKRWDKDQNSCEGNVNNWKLKEEAISERTFVEFFVKEDNAVFGGRGVFPSMEVMLLSKKKCIYLHD